MKSSYNIFVNALSRRSTRESAVCITNDVIFLYLHKFGPFLENAFQISSFLISLTKELVEKIQRSLEAPQKETIYIFRKIVVINSKLLESTEKNDSFSPDKLKCRQYVDEVIDIFKSFEQYILCFVSKRRAASMEQYIDSIVENLNKAIQKYQKINDNIKENENSIKNFDKNSSNLNGNDAITLFIEGTIVIEKMIIQLYSYSANFDNENENIQKMVSKLAEVGKSLLSIHEKDDKTIISKIHDFIFSNLYAILESVNGLQSDKSNLLFIKSEFIEIQMSLIQIFSVINEIESHFSSKNAVKLVKSFSETYTSGKSFDEHILIAKEIFKDTIYDPNSDENADPSFKGAYRLVSKTISADKTDNETIFYNLILILQIYCHFSTISETGEKILLELSREISLIIKETIFKTSQKLINQFLDIINLKIEAFDIFALNSANFFFTTIAGINKYDCEANDFILIQQQFYDILCAFPTYLKRLIETCTDQETKEKVEELVPKIYLLVISLTKWINLFYLVLHSIIIIRANDLVNIFSFPLAVLKTNNIYEDENNVLLDSLDIIESKISKISKILALTPKINGNSPKNILKLVKVIASLSNHGKEFNDVAELGQRFVEFPFLIQAIKSCSHILSDFPNPIKYIPSLFNFENSVSYLCAISASFETSHLIFSEIKKKKMKKKNIFEMNNYFGTFCAASYCLYSSIMLTTLEQDSVEVVNISSLIPSLVLKADKITAISIRYSDTDEKEDNNFPKYNKKIVKILDKILKHIHKFNLPSIPFIIPKRVRELKRFMMITKSILSESLRKFANFLIDTFKISKNKDIWHFLAFWFDVVRTPPHDIYNCIKEMQRLTLKLINKKEKYVSRFVEQFAISSVSLAYHEGNYNSEAIRNIIFKLHQELISDMEQIIELPSFYNTRKQVFVIYGRFSEVSNLVFIGDFPKKEFENHYSDSIRRSINNLYYFAKNKDNDTEDLISIIKTLEELSAFDTIEQLGADGVSVRKAINDIIIDFEQKNNIKKIYDKTITILVNCYLERIPNQFERLKEIENDKIFDIITRKYDQYQDEAIKILELTEAMMVSKEKTLSPLNSMLMYSSDIIVLTSHYMKMFKLRHSKESIRIYENASLLQVYMFKFIHSMMFFRNNQKFAAKLNKINSKTRGVFSLFKKAIKVEKTGVKKDDLSEFDSMKLQVFYKLSNMLFRVSSLCSLASNSYIPLMFSEKSKKIIAKIDKNIPTIQKAVSTVCEKAIGSFSNDFFNSFNEFEVGLANFLTISQHPNFNDNFLAFALVKSYKAIFSAAHMMIDNDKYLIDHIEIKPNPALARKIPDNCVFPSIPNIMPKENVCLHLLKDANSNINSTLKDFESVSNNPVAQPGEILLATKFLHDASNTFAEKVLVNIIYMQKNETHSLFSIEQKLLLHDFIETVNSVQNAMRNRIMRKPSFEKEQKDSLVNYRAKKEIVMNCILHPNIKQNNMNHRSIKSKDAEEFENSNLVTKELASTMKKIEKLSNELMKLNENEKKEEKRIFLPNANNNLFDFLVNSAGQILSSTAKIINRSQELTKNLIRKYGKMDNENGLIQAAQELAESSELLLICADFAKKKENPLHNFNNNNNNNINDSSSELEIKIVAASRIIHDSIIGLVTQVQVKGGDPEKIINKLVAEVSEILQNVIRNTENKAKEKIEKEEQEHERYRESTKKIKVTNPLIKLYNMNQTVSDLRENLKAEKDKLVEFRRENIFNIK